MPSFSKEGADLKTRLLQIYNDWEPQFYDGTRIRKTTDNPQGKGITKSRSHRGLYSLLLSPDEVHLDYLDKRLVKGDSVKSIMGGLGGRVQKLTQGASSPYGLTPTDSLHHGNNHSSYGSTARKQNQSVLRNWLQISADNGTVYGEGAQNLLGNSLEARSHVGSRGKPGTAFNPTLTEGPDGQTEYSAHPRGTVDADVAIPDKLYESGQDMYAAGEGVRKIHKSDAKLGILADTPRRESLIKDGISADILKLGEDPFSPNAPPELRARFKKWVGSSKTAMTNAAKAWNPELAMKASKDFNVNGLGAVGGLMLDPEAMDQMMKGDVAGGIQTGASNMIKGEAFAQVLKKGLEIAGPKLGAVSKVLPYVGPLATVTAGTATANTVLKSATGDGYVDTLKKVQDKGRTKQINDNMVANTHKLNITRQRNVGDMITDKITQGARSLLSIFQP